MLRGSVSIMTLLLGLFSLLVVPSEQANPVASRQPKPKFPALIDEEASQWLSTRSLPRRWRYQNVNHPSADLDQSFKQLHSLYDNGVRQYDTQSFEGVSMEVIFEMVYKQQSSAVSG
ncbi:unnamed protein product [Adineta ricciae]|uniref:Uncharacterized protein n=1 Tax=Adineta ricciae TaxID=249248 RepID=A0A816BZI0_ADIRI|nr:unnamed protein product [Adineta ricciae]